MTDEENSEAHKIWPWNATKMFCPVDGLWHLFGCQCVRDNPELIPGSVRDWYQENWERDTK